MCSRKRVRPPRFFSASNTPLDVYSKDVSVGEELLARAGDGRHRDEGYVFYDMIPLPHSAHAVVGTRQSLLYVSTGRLYSYLEWSIYIAGKRHPRKCHNMCCVLGLT